MSARALRSLGAATVLALGLLGLVPHAASARPPDIAITSPGQGASVTAANIAGQASMRSGTVDWVNLRLTSAEGHPIPVVTKNISGGSDTIPFPWAPATPYNGHYTVEVTAQGTDGFEFPGGPGPETFTATRDFAVEAPPAAPAGVKAAVDQAKRSITVSWTKNPEPDTFAYQVERKQGTTWTKLSTLQATSTSYTDLLGTLPAGTYQYRVIAARPNAAGDAPIVSPPSLTSGKVTTDPPSPPPSTVAGSGNTGGGTTNTNAAGSTSGTSGKPAIATRGKVDLSGFTSLLPQGGKLPAATSTPDPDNGFDEALPFNSGTAASADSAKHDDDVAALGGQSLASSSDEERPTSLLFMAAGLLVTVLLMHVLWLRDEVNKEPLPVVEPEDVPAA